MSMDNKQKIEELYFKKSFSLTKIAKALNISVSYVSRVLRSNVNYQEEKKRRETENLKKRRNCQKKIITELRKRKATQNLIENQTMRKQHNQAAKELSKKRTLNKETLRKWCSLYDYNKEKQRYEFNTKEGILKPNDFPLYIKVKV